MGWRGFELIAAAWVCSAALIMLMLPMFRRYALARPNARSSHTIPTPQGGGLAVILAMMIALGANILLVGPELTVPSDMLPLGAAVVLLTVVGAADDIFPLSPSLRLGVQAVAVTLAVSTMPEELRALPVVPVPIERAVEILAGLWFVNLVNFMDGLDLMTAAEVVPVTFALLLLGLSGAFPEMPAVVATALCGAMLGFAPFNRPVAKVFLGDVGSLPIGLLLGWCLLQLAWHQQLVAALLLPLYYLADATITLFRRVARREPFWIAHRSHFYQRATDNGFTVPRVISEVFALNLVLALLAVATVRFSSTIVTTLALLSGAIAVGAVLRRFSGYGKS